MNESKPAEREISSIAFPYVDLDTAIGFASAILNAGSGALTRDQLAGLLGTSTSSGTFLMKLSATRMFGLIKQTAQGKFELTPLGYEILDKDEVRLKAARKEAFLNAPLYRRVYDEFKGKQLPPRPHGLEQAFVRIGVSNKQKANARLAFDKSAQQAGYFAAGQDRLIEPIIAPSQNVLEDVKATPTAYIERDEIHPVAISQTPPPPPLHHFIKGLVESLPKAGGLWEIEKRAKWLRAAANNFDLMYTGDGEIVVTVKSNGSSEAEASKNGPQEGR